MFISNDRRILSFQFHPEYLSEYIRFMEGRWHQEDKHFKGIHSPHEERDDAHHESADSIRRALRKFIEYEV